MRPSYARLLPLALGYALASAGCDGVDVDDLEPGTFVIEAGGETYRGTATFEPRTSGPAELDVATVFLTPREGRRYLMAFASDAFLDASAGDRFVPEARFFPDDKSYIQDGEGAFRITAAEPGRIEGTFRFRMRDISTGPFQGRDLTVEGGFHARTVAE